MCTVIVATQVHANYPLLVVANRDEALRRPAEGPKWRQGSYCRYFAPQDLKAGGTWLGLNEHDLFVALTNRFGVADSSQLRSRGHLVQSFLELSDIDEAHRRGQALDPQQEKGFHLIIANREKAVVIGADGKRLWHQQLPPGVHVVTERAFGAQVSQRLSALEAHFAAPVSTEKLSIEALQKLMGSHGSPGLEGVCVHYPEMDYGTRSSTLVALSQSERFWWHSDGPPCKTAYVDHSKALQSPLKAP